MPRPQRSTKPTHSRVRAGKACKRCNQKRIKFGAMFETPCANCVQAGKTDCVLRPTRRGTYIRKTHFTTSPEPAPIEVDGDGPAKGLGKGTEVTSDTSAPPATDEPASVRPTAFSSQPFWDNDYNDSPEQPALQSDSNGLSYRDISWSAMFDHFLNTRRTEKNSIDKCSITYLGESFPLAIVLDDLNEGSRLKLHHPGPPVPGHDPSTGIATHQTPCAPTA
ncbi:hypothetical protein BDV12DRAFT_202996 [Aspergillus spectabilis]